MKKMILCATTAFFMTVCLNAQTVSTANPVSPETKDGMKDLRKDLRDVKKDRHQLHREIKEGDKAGARAVGRDIREDKKDIHEDAAALKGQGVKHPIKRAGHQIRRRNR